MLDHNLMVENMSKRKQKKWARFERDHSMSLWQGDWKKIGEKWLIVFMDDSSRLITCYGLFNSPTTKNTIKVLEKGFTDYGAPDEVLTVHGTQFVAAKNRENAKHKFKKFLDKNGVKHIVARINHPQTNGKIERFFGLVEQKAILFNSINELFYWYNYIKPHMALDFDELETPDQAFHNRLPPERVLSTSGRWLIEERNKFGLQHFFNFFNFFNLQLNYDDNNSGIFDKSKHLILACFLFFFYLVGYWGVTVNEKN